MNENSRRRLIAVIALLVSGGILSYLAFGNIGDNLVYYWSPSELLEAGDDAIGANIRLGGLVKPGTIEHGDGLTLEFSVTDGKHTVPVLATAVPPAMFRDRIGVVLEGTLRADGRFETQRLMVKHDNEYRAPDDPDSINIKEMMRSLQFEESNV